MLKAFTLLLLFSLVLHSMANRDSDCSAHQKYESCGTACPENCENYSTESDPKCSRECVPGCFCEDPYIFKVGKTGECVLPSQCPRKFLEYRDVRSHLNAAGV